MSDEPAADHDIPSFTPNPAEWANAERRFRIARIIGRVLAVFTVVFLAIPLFVPDGMLPSFAVRGEWRRLFGEFFLILTVGLVVIFVCATPPPTPQMISLAENGIVLAWRRRVKTIPYDEIGFVTLRRRRIPDVSLYSRAGRALETWSHPNDPGAFLSALRLRVRLSKAPFHDNQEAVAAVPATQVEELSRSLASIGLIVALFCCIVLSEPMFGNYAYKSALMEYGENVSAVVEDKRILDQICMLSYRLDRENSRPIRKETPIGYEEWDRLEPGDAVAAYTLPFGPGDCVLVSGYGLGEIVHAVIWVIAVAGLGAAFVGALARRLGARREYAVSPFPALPGDIDGVNSDPDLGDTPSFALASPLYRGETAGTGCGVLFCAGCGAFWGITRDPALLLLFCVAAVWLFGRVFSVIRRLELGREALILHRLWRRTSIPYDRMGGYLFLCDPTPFGFSAPRMVILKTTDGRTAATFFADWSAFPRFFHDMLRRTEQIRGEAIPRLSEKEGAAAVLDAKEQKFKAGSTALFLCVALFMFVPVLEMWRDGHALRREGVWTDGVALAVYNEGTGRDSLRKILYVFEDSSGNTHTKYENLHDAAWERYYPGASVRMAYLPDSPWVCAVWENLYGGVRPYGLMAAVLAVACFAALLAVFRWRAALSRTIPAERVRQEQTRETPDPESPS